MLTLEPWQAADEIDKLAHAISVLDKALDRLWPRLPLDAMQRLSVIAQLEQIDAALATRLGAIADEVREIH